jgi:hypothetical protein
MAFGKKKKDDEAPEPARAAVGEPEDEAAAAEGMFAPEEPAEEDDAITAGLMAEEKAAASSDALSSDLLNMFQTTQIESTDLSVVLDLAGDVELDDLLEELQTVALALGCRLPGQDEDSLAA